MSNKMFVFPYLLLGAFSFVDCHLSLISNHGGFRLWPRKDLYELANWDPFYEDPLYKDPFYEDPFFEYPFELDFFHARYPTATPHPLLKRNDKEIFQLSMDVKGFNPEDISVKIVGRELLVKGVHSCQNSHQHNCCPRRFCWRPTLPEDVDVKSFKATLTESNTLELQAKKNKFWENDIKITNIRDKLESHVPPPNEENFIQNGKQELRNMTDEDATVEIVPDETELTE